MDIHGIARRVVGSLSGPIFFAAANFSISVVMQRNLSPREFGLFAFCQLVTASSLAISNGLFSAPMTVLARRDGYDRYLGGFRVAGAIFCVLSALVSLCLIHLAGGGRAYMAATFLFTLAMSFRWYFRSEGLAEGERKSASMSDILYGIMGIGAAAVVLMTGSRNTEAVIVAQAACVFVAASPFLKRVSSTVRSISLSHLSVYREIFSKNASWSTLSVGATEVAVSFHGYAVTLFLGAAAFAPIALATLVFRPVGVVLSGLVQFERPRLAGSISLGDWKGAGRTVMFMQTMVVICWAGNASLALLLAAFPKFLGHESYSKSAVFIALAAIGLITFLRAWREPTSAALQAAGEFRSLALMSCAGGAVTAIAVTLVLMLGPHTPSLSLLGVAFSEVALLVMMRRLYTRIRKR